MVSRLRDGHFAHRRAAQDVVQDVRRLPGHAQRWERERVYGLTLEVLDTYARAHVAQEEECMHRHRCPVADKNARAHAQFVRLIAGFRHRYVEKGFDRADAMVASLSAT